MRWWSYLLLMLGGLAVAVFAASPQTVPGYMDAEYYYAGAQNLAGGQGWQEPYLWNYLNAPQQIPQPAFTYWMPLVSLLAAAGLKIFPAGGWWSARLVFLLLAACIPPLTAYLAFHLTARSFPAWMAGMLALFPGFYLAYLTTTDAFTIYMLAGGLFFILTSRLTARSPRAQPGVFLALGILAGLMHLSRADGLLWLAAAGGLAIDAAWRMTAGAERGLDRLRRMLRPAVVSLIPVFVGYAGVMSPWYGRNLHEWGALFPPGGSRTLWLVAYEQTMVFPASLLTGEAWLASGWQSILSARWEALTANLQTALAVQGGTVLLPFILVGMWRLRACLVVRLAVILWLLTFVVMSLVFPFAGLNGAFFHSGAAFQPLLWALAPLGIETVVLWAARLRRWERGGHVLVFLAGLLLVVSILLSVGTYFQRVVGSEPNAWAWSRANHHYQEVDSALMRLGAQDDQRVLVNDPPGYYLASEREAIVIPYGDEDMLLSAARQFQVDYLVLELNNPWMLEALYLRQSSRPEIVFLEAVGTTHLYQINRGGAGVP